MSYFRCSMCDLRFLDPSKRLSPSDEIERYKLHNNDIYDPRYRAFVKPLFQEIVRRIDGESLGLDYGAGPGPMVATMLNEKNIKVDLYDPYFKSSALALNRSYNFIYASESAEHFYDPHMEFTRMRRCLEPDGFVAVMTLMYTGDVPFSDWYYRKDPTHVSFYSPHTMRWIGASFGFKNVEIISARIVVFS